MENKVMILPSNALASAFPHNTSARFTLPLSETISGTQHIRLTEVILPLTFYNVENYFYVKLHFNNGESKSFNIPEGLYLNAQQLCETLNHIIKVYLIPDITFEHSWNYIVFQGNENITKLELHPKLARLVGLPGVSPGYIITATNEFDALANHRILYIKSDNVKPIPYNQTCLRLLQMIVLPPEIKFGENYTIQFDYPETITLEGDIHRQFHISIEDLDGHPIRFRSGTLLIKATHGKF
jgi:hypothetical protein